jgi:phosphopantothenoylcysteine synthetase/decarboxylase
MNNVELIENTLSKLPNKKIIVLGGGTNSYITNHLAISAPSYGNTTKQIAEKFKQHLFNKMDVDLILTKMAHPSDKNAPDTPEDVEVIVKQIVKDPAVRIVVFNVALVDFKPISLKYQTTDSDVGGRYIRDTTFGKDSKQLHKVEYAELAFKPYDKIINLIKKERKDILLVVFKTTCGATKEEMFTKGLKLCKESSANIVFVNDVDKTRIEKLEEAIEARNNIFLLRKCFKSFSYVFPNFTLQKQQKILTHSIRKKGIQNVGKAIELLQSNALITPEESSCWYDTREQALDALVDMTLKRSTQNTTQGFKEA